MKKPYTKPMVSFENYALDMPIAAGCSDEYINDALDIKEQGWVSMGYFNANEDCVQAYTAGNDKLCYLTVSAQLFTS